jgi:hypothetical protein
MSVRIVDSTSVMTTQIAPWCAIGITFGGGIYGFKVVILQVYYFVTTLPDVVKAVTEAT